uniref:P53 and DNA damage-regulated protein 1 n=1 Tax=Rhabditophanes sp. KR3021 TaxID=114890 RepID=A0AC35TVJ0_9BILA
MDQSKKIDDIKRKIGKVSNDEVNSLLQLLESTSIEAEKVKRSCKDDESLTFGRSDEVSQPSGKAFSFYDKTSTKDIVSSGAPVYVKMNSAVVAKFMENSLKKHPKVKVSERPFEFSESLSTLHGSMYKFLSQSP